MRTWLVVLLLAGVAAGQNERGGAEAPAGGSISPVQFDSNGWPIVSADDPAPSKQAGPRSAERRVAEAEAEAVAQAPTPTNADAGPLASGMQLDSPLHDVYRATRSPGAFRELGGVRVFWRLTVHGTQGEAIGIREVTHVCDCGAPDRDRLEHQDGRVFGRLGEQAFAQRGGIPWPTLRDAASAELELFGTLLRAPWCFGEGSRYAIMSKETVERQGERLTKLVIERRPPADAQVFGPEADPKPRDAFELLFEPTTGQPRELVHRFASSLQTRRVLLDDWREVGGVRMPHRRIYVDEAMRPTTTVELLRIQRERVGERDFRLH